MTGNGLEVTPSFLENTARDGLLIRIDQQTDEARGFPHGISTTTIYLFCISPNGEGRHSLCEVRYQVVEPIRDYPTGLTVMLHGTDPSSWYGYFEDKVIPDWKERIPEWLPAEPAIASRDGPRGAKQVEIARVGLLTHWSMLQQRLAYERYIQVHALAELSTAHNRMAAFNREGLIAWTKTGGI